MMRSILVFQEPGGMNGIRSQILLLPFGNIQFFQVLHPFLRMIDDAAIQTICPEGLIVQSVISQFRMKLLYPIPRIFHDPEFKTLKCHMRMPRFKNDLCAAAVCPSRKPFDQRNVQSLPGLHPIGNGIRAVRIAGLHPERRISVPCVSSIREISCPVRPVSVAVVADAYIGC